MNKKQKLIMLKNYILENKGVTCGLDLIPLKLSTGYMVSLKGFEFTSKNINDIMEMIDLVYLGIAKDKRGCVGVWYNELDLLYYLDISLLINNKKSAISLAKHEEQKAIFDNEKKESIYLNYDIIYWTLYDVNMRVVKQVDNIEELVKMLKCDRKYLINNSRGKHLINNQFYLFSDKINIKEL